MAKEYWITINGSLHNIGDVVEAEQIKYYGMGVGSQTAELERLQDENKRLRVALGEVLDKTVTMTGHYPESNDERIAYGLEAFVIFDEIWKNVRVALEGGK